MIALLAFLLPSTILQADTLQSVSDSSWNLHFQQTAVTQWHYSFPASYSGIKSFNSNPETKTSLTSTLFFGLKLWNGGEFYFNPELTGGEGLSDATGIAGFPNGEIYRVGNPTPTPFAARIYLKHTIALSEESESIRDAANQLSSRRPVYRLTLVAGKFGLTDFFDDNAYSHDPRTQFLNWALMDNGAWDYAADTRGYTWGIFAELSRERWALRAAVTLVPTEANQLEMDTGIRDAFSLNVEYERKYMLSERDGVVRLFVYRNLARMGNYRLATDNQQYQKDITLTERYSRVKFGFGINLEQKFSINGGAFLRLGWNDGENETWAFTEIDHSASVGAMWSGNRWKRMNDNAGIAVVVNGISKDHRDYLEAGGHGFIIGDGTLRYQPEAIFEAFYKASITPGISLTGDYQFVLNPAYNTDRGPVHIYAVRMHVEI